MTERTYGTRDDILEADDRLTEDVFVPEFGGKWFKIRGLTGMERERFEAGLGTVKRGSWHPSSKGTALAQLVALSVVDANGGPLFTPDDVDKLKRKNAAGLSRIADVCRRLSGLSDDDMEELEGNSEGDQSDSSTSSSPSPSVAASTSSSDPSPAES